MSSPIRPGTSDGPAGRAAMVIRDLLAAGHSVRFRASGWSMWPLIRSEDLLHVEPIGTAGVENGDVVLSLTARGLTAHRLLRIEGDGEGIRYATRGDHAPCDDDPFARHELLGRVVATERSDTIRPVSSRQGLALALERLLTRAALRAMRIMNQETSPPAFQPATAEEP